MSMQLLMTRAGILLKCTECGTQGTSEEMSYGHDCEVGV